MRDQCTKNKTGRTITRHVRQEDLDVMHEKATRAESRSDLKLRQHLGERSFATATRYGYKRARWRRLWRLQIQDYLTCTLQNIMKLVKHENRRVPAVAAQPSALRPVESPLSALLAPLEAVWTPLDAFWRFCWLQRPLGRSRRCDQEVIWSFAVGQQPGDA